jgi:ATP-dependent Clp protease ATP-binding subunit ClpC
MALKYSDRTERLRASAEQISKDEGHFYLGAEHLFMALLKDEPFAAQMLQTARIEQEALLEGIREIAEKGDGHPLWDGIIETPRIKKIYRNAERDAETSHSREVEPNHVMAGILFEEKCVPARVMRNLGADLRKVRENLIHLKLPEERVPVDKSERDFEKRFPTLTRYSRDLTRLAKDGKLDPVVGRQDELRRTLQILTRKSKNNPVLIGEAGVGKTAVVIGLALRIASGQVPEVMAKKRLFELNMSSVVAGTKHRGEFEERLQKLVEEVTKMPDVILFIDEIHTIVGAGDVKGGMDAGNILKPILARGEFPCIGATTTDEYRRYIESDPALERRFQPVMVSEPSEEEALEILKGLKERYERHHGVTFDEKALLAAVKLSVRYLPDRFLPDKAIDLMDEAAAKIKIRSVVVEPGEKIPYQVTEETVAEVVSLWTGIPVAKLTQEESEKLLQMEDMIRGRLIGQEDAVRVVAQTIRMVRMGLASPTRPAGVFLFLGPTGVGKTEMAKALAEFLFGSEKEMVRLDMSEFMEKHAITRLVGSPPGYVGHEEEGQLTKAVRTKPYSVVLLDEIEKAHPEVFDLFLQVFDDGRLTDSKGRTVNFTNTIIIMTSNLGTSQVDEHGNIQLMNLDDPNVREEIMKVLRKSFRPEFLNRIDETIIFKPLTRDEISRIVDLNIKDLARRLQDKQLSLEIDPTALEFLLKNGYSPAYGARPMKRAIQSYIIKPLAEEMLKFGVRAGDTLIIKAEGDSLTFAKKEEDFFTTQT